MKPVRSVEVQIIDSEYLGFFSFPYEEMPGRIPVHPEALQSLWDQIVQWGDFLFNELTNPWRLDIPLLLYRPHLWTILISFRGSMVVFLACLPLIRVRSYARIGLLILVVLTALPHERWNIAVFLSGVLQLIWPEISLYKNIWTSL